MHKGRWGKALDRRALGCGFAPGGSGDWFTRFIILTLGWSFKFPVKLHIREQGRLSGQASSLFAVFPMFVVITTSLIFLAQKVNAVFMLSVAVLINISLMCCTE